MSITSEEIMMLEDEGLLAFADQYLGMNIPKGTPRTKILTKIFNAAEAARDGATPQM